MIEIVRISHFKIEKRWYHPHKEKGFDSIVVNRPWPSISGELLEITSTVSLQNILY